MGSKTNLFQWIFIALFVLKIGEVRGYADLSWLTVAAPLIIGSILNWIYRLLDDTGILARTKEAALMMYVEDLKKRVIKKELNKLKKQQSNSN